MKKRMSTTVRRRAPSSREIAGIMKLQAIGMVWTLTLLWNAENVEAFSNPKSARRSHYGTSSSSQDRPRSLTETVPRAPFSVPTATRTSSLFLSQKSSEQTEEKEEALSDVDARVLQEMLQESKLDLETEDDIRKLLERGTVKSTVNLKEQEQAEVKQRKEDSPFDSTILQTFTDTKLWKKLSAQTSDLLESAKIWVSNKVEADLKVAAALGLFAWERAVRDVARALPAASSAAQTVMKQTPLSLTNTSSYQEPPPKTTSIRDDLNRPEDEIKEVSRAVFQILKGESVDGASNARALRTAARAGTVNSAERQKRAFRQRRRLDRRNRDLGRITGSVMDATYELQRELKAETSTAGYKTKPIRKAIAAGTAGVLSAVKETAQIAAAKRQERLALKQAAVNRTAVYSELLNERLALQQRLVDCIEEPQTTWLASDYTKNLSEDKLRQVGILLMRLRDDMVTKAQPSIAEGEKVTVEQAEALLQVLRSDVQAIQALKSNVQTDISFVMADALCDAILGISSDEATMEALRLRLNEVQETLRRPSASDTADVEPESEGVFFADQAVQSESIEGEAPVDIPELYVETQDGPVAEEEPRFIDAFVVDVVPDVVMESDSVAEVLEGDAEVVVETPNYKSFVAEVVSDDDVDTAFGGAKEVKNLSEEEYEEEQSVEEPNIAVKAALRTLDILFFVVEKTLTVVLPSTIQCSITAVRRYGEVQRDGKGSEGWERLRNSADAKGRY